MRPAALCLAIPLAAMVGAQFGCREEPPAKMVGGQALPVQGTPGENGVVLAYAAGPDGLKQLWMDILKAAERDDRGKVHDLMGSMIMTQDDLVALFGDDRNVEADERADISRDELIGADNLDHIPAT